MNPDVRRLVLRYQSAGLLVDTNILLLYFVGSFDKSWIERFKRTRDRYTAKDFDLFERFRKRFDRIVTTPHILSEVSNLSRGFGEPVKTKYFEHFAARIGLLAEEHVASAEAARLNHFPKLGLTDSGIMHLVKDKYLVLTDDLMLYSFLGCEGIDSLNFNHLRLIL